MKASEYQISCESIVLEQIPARVEYRQSPVVDERLPTQQKVLNNGSDYVKSCAYLIYKQNGKVIKRVKIRQNEYTMSNRVILVSQ